MTITRSIGLLGAALAALVATSCAGPTAPTAGPASPPSAGVVVAAEHNDADTTFVQGMIPHHAQAVAMAQLAPTRAASPQVKDLATRIEQAQDPEIEQMRGFLAAWGVVEDDQDMNGVGAGGTDHSGMGPMSGMMTPAQMGQLDQATGAAFDRLFLQQMTAHHTGAVQMAETELLRGQNTDAKALAQRIIDAQRAEITEMGQLLTTV